MTSRQDYQSSSSSNSMHGMPVNEWHPVRTGTSNNNYPNRGYSTVASSYDNAVINAAVAKVSGANQEEVRRPRSPVQRILRYRLDDPELTSLNDTRYRPYYKEGNSRGRGSSNKKKNQHWQQLYYNPLPKKDQLEGTQPPQKVTDYGDPQYNTDDGEDKRLPSKEKEKEFIDRCMNLGVSFHWYKLKKTVDGEILENVAIEMKYGQTPFKVYGGFYDPIEAKEMAFLEGLRRLEFLFGKAGKPAGGFWSNYGQGGPGPEPLEMLPNPCNEFQWTIAPPPPPPPLPKFAPKNKPPLPTCPPPAQPERRLWEEPQPLPPGYTYKAGEYFGFVPNPHPKVVGDQPTSSWAEMSSNAGFFHNHAYADSLISQAPLPKKTDNFIAGKQEAFQQVWADGSAVEKASDASLTQNNAGPKESVFLEKIKNLGLFYSCNELPVEIRSNKVRYYAFEIQFWKWNNPSCQEKVVGSYSPFVGIARESVFSVALQKINSASSSAATSKVKQIINEDDKFPGRRFGGMGRGLIFNEEETMKGIIVRPTSDKTGNKPTTFMPGWR